MATIKLTLDFKEFLNLLNSEKIDYLLIGGYAVWLYGHPRPTKDIDLWVAIDEASQARLLEVLVKFGFARNSLRLPLFEGKRTMLRMGVPPNRLEVLSNILGVEFEKCFARRRMMDVDGIIVPVIDYDDLLRSKRAAGRPRDMADVDTLEKRRNKP